MKDKLKVGSFSFLPKLKYPSEVPIDGILQKVPSFCKRRFDDKCSEHYQNCGEGISKCPYGYSTYKFNNGNEDIIWTCLKVKKFYDKDKVNNRKDSKLNKLYTREELQRLFTENNKVLKELNQILDTKLLHAKEKINESLKHTKNTFHEIRPLNAELQASHTRLKSKLGQLKSTMKDEDYWLFYNEFQKIIKSSDLISLRMEMRDFLIDPSTGKRGQKRKFPIKKESENMFALFKSRMKKEKISHKVHVDQHRAIESYDIFPLSLFVLIENALKYFPESIDQEVSISESLTSDVLCLQISSIGPLIEDSEKDKIFEPFYRGINAKKSYEGTGVGLFLAKKICKTLNHKVSVEQNKEIFITYNSRDYYKTTFYYEIPRKHIVK